MKIWEYASIKLDPQESVSTTLKLNGELGWEAWHIDEHRTERGVYREVYFKRERGTP